MRLYPMGYTLPATPAPISVTRRPSAIALLQVCATACDERRAQAHAARPKGFDARAFVTVRSCACNIPPRLCGGGPNRASLRCDLDHNHARSQCVPPLTTCPSTAKSSPAAKVAASAPRPATMASNMHSVAHRHQDNLQDLTAAGVGTAIDGF